MNYFLIAFHSMLAAAIGFQQFRRSRALGRVDIFTVFGVLYLLNYLIPPIFIYLFEDQVVKLNALTQTVLAAASSEEKLYLAALVVVAYVGVAAGFRLVKPRAPDPTETLTRLWPLKFYWLSGVALFLLAVYIFANSLGGGWEAVLLASQYRAGLIKSVGRGTSVSYLLMSVSLPVSLIASTCFASTKRSRQFFFLLEFCLIMLATVCIGARRVVLVWGLMKVLLALHDRRRISLVVLLLASAGFALVLAYGEILFVMASDLSSFDYTKVLSEREDSFSAVASAVSMDLGISFLESLGMLSLYHGGFRFGIDSLQYVLSLLTFSWISVPEPERFVRFTTALLTGDPLEADVPPGFIGYMWVNFGVIGVFLQSMLYGMLGGGLSRFIAARFKGRFGVFVYFYVAYIWALLINSGNWEYWFGDYWIANLWVAGGCAVAFLFGRRRHNSHRVAFIPNNTSAR